MVFSSNVSGLNTRVSSCPSKGIVNGQSSTTLQTIKVTSKRWDIQTKSGLQISTIQCIVFQSAMSDAASWLIAPSILHQKKCIKTHQNSLTSCSWQPLKVRQPKSSSPCCNLIIPISPGTFEESIFWAGEETKGNQTMPGNDHQLNRTGPKLRSWMMFDLMLTNSKNCPTTSNLISQVGRCHHAHRWCQRPCSSRSSCLSASFDGKIPRNPSPSR